MGDETHAAWLQYELALEVPACTIKSIKKKLNFNPKDFNPLLYDFDFDKNQIYRVDGTDYIINIIPKQLK